MRHLYMCMQPQKTVSVLHRPIRPSMGKKNLENIDLQYEKDKAAAERQANSMRRTAGQRWHHNGPGTNTILDQVGGRSRAARRGWWWAWDWLVVNPA
jgi:hypothetical protein